MMGLEVGRWRGRSVEVTARQVPRFLWITASIDVFVDSRCVLRSGGKLSPVSSVRAEFEEQGNTHDVELSWGVGWLRSFPVEVKIDGEPIGSARVPVRNWVLSLWPSVALVGLFVLGIAAYLAPK